MISIAYRTKQNLTIEIDGTEIYYTAMLKDPHLQTMLLVHGAGSHAESFSLVTDRLEGDYNWIAVDLPGHFRSKGQARTTIEENVDFIHTFVQMVMKKHALQGGFVYLGHSFGGAIGIAAAAAQLPWLEKLILVATSADFTNVLSSEFIAKLDNNVLDLAFYKNGFSPNSPQVFFEALVSRLHYVSLQATARDFKATVPFNYIDQLTRIQSETLIITANDDRIMPEYTGAVLQSGIASSTWIQIANAGHFVVMEKPQEVAAAIDSFMN